MRKMTDITSKRYRMPLCPYLMIGNHRLLIHLDAYGVPQSLQWPYPGSADRLGWRNFCDEWPYWEEMTPEAICAKMPYFIYPDGSVDYLHEATTVEIDYIEGTNILAGRYVMPGGTVIELTSFAAAGRDIWMRHYRVTGYGKFICQGEFFEKSVRGHSLTHMGEVNFRGFFDAEPRGFFAIMSTRELTPVNQTVEVIIDGETEWTLQMSIGDDMAVAVEIGKKALTDGYETVLQETIKAEQAWISRALEPRSKHPFILKNYKRWLLSNYLLTAKDGSTISGVRPFWTFAWPRDCSAQAAGFAAAGFIREAQAILKWNLDRTPASGVHEARYWSDGTPVLLDNRPRQGDCAGFLCWATAYVCSLEWDEAWLEAVREKLFFIADHLVRDKDKETLLPLPEADHRETQVAESLSIAVSAAGGLHSVADIAQRLGDNKRAIIYSQRAEEIVGAIEKHLWRIDEKYFITSVKPDNFKADISICWAALPFNVWPADDPKMIEGIMKIYRDRWDSQAGGVLAMTGTPYASYWMYYTSILLLGLTWIGRSDLQKEILDSLERNASPQGLIPEQISLANGNLWGCAPLPPPQANLLFYAFRD